MGDRIKQMVIARIKTLLIPARNVGANPKLLRVRVFYSALVASSPPTVSGSRADDEDDCSKQENTFPPK